MPIHLNSLSAVKDFAAELMNKTERLDFLINNAAQSHGPYGFTMDNHESTMAIGHLAHYLLTEQLLPLLKKTKPAARIIIISSNEHYSGSVSHSVPHSILLISLKVTYDCFIILVQRIWFLY